MGCSASCVSLEYSAWWLLRRLYRSDQAIRSRRIGGMRCGWHSCYVLVSLLRCGCRGKKTKHCGVDPVSWTLQGCATELPDPVQVCSVMAHLLSHSMGLAYLRVEWRRFRLQKTPIYSKMAEASV